MWSYSGEKNKVRVRDNPYVTKYYRERISPKYMIILLRHNLYHVKKITWWLQRFTLILGCNVVDICYSKLLYV